MADLGLRGDPLDGDRGAADHVRMPARTVRRARPKRALAPTARTSEVTGFEFKVAPPELLELEWAAKELAWLRRMTGATVRLRATPAAVTARAILAIGGSHEQAARHLVHALASLDSEVVERDLRRPLRRMIRTGLRMLPVRRLACELNPADIADWSELSMANLGLDPSSIERLFEAAQSLRAAYDEVLAQLDDRGRPGRTLFLWEELDQQLDGLGFTSGDRADLVIASTTDWEPQPCPDYKPWLPDAPASSSGRTRLLQDLAKKRQRYLVARR